MQSDVIDGLRDAQLKAGLFNSNVLPALAYGCQTCGLTKVHENKLKKTQPVLERRLLGITLQRQRLLNLRNSDIRNMSSVKDILTHADEANRTEP